MAIYDLVKFCGFSDPLAKYVVSQAGHETNGFTSAVYRQNNNAFGMKYVGQSLAKGEKNGYADYETVEKSVQDMWKWWIHHRSGFISFPLLILSLEDYVSFLKRNKYFEDDEAVYLKGCKHFFDMLFNVEGV